MLAIQCQREVPWGTLESRNPNQARLTAKIGVSGSPVGYDVIEGKEIEVGGAEIEKIILEDVILFFLLFPIFRGSVLVTYMVIPSNLLILSNLIFRPFQDLIKLGLFRGGWLK